VLLCLLLFFTGVGGRALWDIDEGMHAAMSKEMVVTGDWVVPRLNGEVFRDKPPMYPWLVAVSLAVFGFNEFAARLPSGLLALALVLMTYRFGRSIVGPLASFLAAVILTCSIEVVVLSRSVVHDMCFSLFVALAMFALYRGYIDDRRRRVYLMLAYAAIGGAVLTKGPLGAVLTGGTLLVFLGLRRDLRFLRRMMLVPGVLLVAAITAPWFLMMDARDPGYLRYFLIEQNFGQYLSSPRHPEPFYTYIPVLALGLAPWSAFLPAALWRLLRRPAALDPARLFFLVWLGFVFVFFSAASSKLPTYILPLFPAAALLLGDLWSPLWKRGSRVAPPRWLIGSYVGLAVVVILAVVVGLKTAVDHPFFEPDTHTQVLIAAVVPIAAALGAAGFLLWRRRYRILFGVTASAIVLILLLATAVLARNVDGYRSTKMIALEIDTLLAPGEKIVSYKRLLDSALFYTDRRMTVLKRFDELERSLEEGKLCIVADRRKRELEELRDRTRVVYRFGNKLILQGVDR
jgi:4-amino-4-deoxy-L-arabinose transferase-like glycosyltransferase